MIISVFCRDSVDLCLPLDRLCCSDDGIFVPGGCGIPRLESLSQFGSRRIRPLRSRSWLSQAREIGKTAGLRNDA